MADLGNIMTTFFGTTFEFYNLVINTMAKVAPYTHTYTSAYTHRFPQFKLEDTVEEINESHVGYWTEMVNNSNPPVKHMHYSAYMDIYYLKKHVVAFNAQKLKEIVGYKLRRPKIDDQTLREVIDKLKAEGSWPVLPAP